MQQTVAQAVGPPTNLIMSGCELDSLTDGPDTKLEGAWARVRGGREGRGGEGTREVEAARSGAERRRNVSRI